MLIYTFNFFSDLYQNQTISFFYFDCLLLFLILYTFAGLVGEFGEKRIIVFFIYFELIQLIIVVILIIGALYQPFGQEIYLTIALIIIGASGAEIAIFLALFIRYYRLTGLTTFVYNKKNSKKN